MTYLQPLSARTVGAYAQACALTTQALGRGLDVERRRVQRWTRSVSTPPRVRQAVTERHDALTGALSAIIDRINGHRGPVLLRTTDRHPEVTFGGSTLPAVTWKEAISTLLTINQLGLLDRVHELVVVDPPEGSEEWVELRAEGEPTFAVLDRTPTAPQLHLCRTRLPADGEESPAPDMDAAYVLATITLPAYDSDRPAPFLIAMEPLENLGYRPIESWTFSGLGTPIATAAILPDYSLPYWADVVGGDLPGEGYDGV